MVQGRMKGLRIQSDPTSLGTKCQRPDGILVGDRSPNLDLVDCSNCNWKKPDQRSIYDPPAPAANGLAIGFRSRLVVSQIMQATLQT